MLQGGDRVRAKSSGFQGEVLGRAGIPESVQSAKYSTPANMNVDVVAVHDPDTGEVRFFTYGALEADT